MTPDLPLDRIKQLAAETHHFVTQDLPVLGQRMTYCPRCLITLPPGPLMARLPKCGLPAEVLAPVDPS